MNKISYLEQQTMEDVANKSSSTLDAMLLDVTDCIMYKKVLTTNDIITPTDNALAYVEYVENLKIDVKYLQHILGEVLKIKTSNL